MPTTKYTITRNDSEIELEIDYRVSPRDPGCSPSLNHPGEPPSGGDIEDLFIAGPDGNEFTVTAAELDAIERHIYDTHNYYED